MPGILALVAERERELTSERTKAALAAAKRRGTRLGSPDPRKAGILGRQSVRRLVRIFDGNVRPVIAEIRDSCRTPVHLRQRRQLEPDT